MDDPVYQLVARQAYMYQTGGYFLEKDPNKAGKEANIEKAKLDMFWEQLSNVGCGGGESKQI